MTGFQEEGRAGRGKESRMLISYHITMKELAEAGLDSKRNSSVA
jgi:hypothetical protein